MLGGTYHEWRVTMNMHASLRFAALCLATVLSTSACKPHDVTGSWTGTWRATLDLADGGMDLELDQVDDEVTGTSSLTGTICVPDGNFDGFVEGDKFDGSFTNGVGEVALHGRISANGERIEGDFDVLAGLCDGWTGTFELKKR